MRTSSRRRGWLGQVLVLGLALAVATVAAGCGERESDRLGRELRDRLATEGFTVDEAVVWPPRGTVPHWVIDLAVPGGAADAETVCDHVAQNVTYEGEAPYLVRVSYQPAGAVECGWAKEPGGSHTPGTSPRASGSP